jgi:hypothetical protein
MLKNGMLNNNMLQNGALHNGTALQIGTLKKRKCYKTMQCYKKILSENGNSNA